MENPNMQNLLDAAAETAAQPEPQEAEPVQLIDEAELALRLRAQELIAQARTIQAITRTDVMRLYNTDMDVRARILSGEWDFIDVWKHMEAPAQPAVPVRSANGGVGSVNISAMNEQQFDKLNEMLSKGAKIDMQGLRP